MALNIYSLLESPVVSGIDSVLSSKFRYFRGQADPSNMMLRKEMLIVVPEHSSRFNHTIQSSIPVQRYIKVERGENRFALLISSKPGHDAGFVFISSNQQKPWFMIFWRRTFSKPATAIQFILTLGKAPILVFLCQDESTTYHVLRYGF